MMAEISNLFPASPQPSSSIPNTVGVQILGKLDETIRQSGEYEKITDLVLDQIQFGSFTTQIYQMLSRCKRLTYLSMEFCQLEALDNMVIFPNLEILELGYNRLKDKDLFIISSIGTLRTLTLTKNLIEKVESLAILTVVPHLLNLTLVDNPLTSTPDYKTRVFEILPRLQALDGKDRDNQTVLSSSKEDQGQGQQGEDEQMSYSDNDEEDQAEIQQSDNGEEPEMRKIRKLQ